MPAFLILLEQAPALLGLFFSLIVGGVAIWLRKIYWKRRMQEGLGRKVEDRELTDIAEWMEAMPADEAPDQNKPPRPHI